MTVSQAMHAAQFTMQQIHDKCDPLAMVMIGMIDFGGIDFITGFELTVFVFLCGFSEQACPRARAEVGSAPLTRKCLSACRFNCYWP